MDEPCIDVDPDWMRTSEARLAGFHDLLAAEGEVRGIIGPREVPRLWPRHLLNCVCVADPQLHLIPEGARVGDIGSGAGLPGLVWALARRDLSITLVEPLQRRTNFLDEAIDRLDLAGQVTVVQSRAQDLAPLGLDVVTSRALAPLPTVVEWSLPHLAPGGHLLAMKGGKASQELAAARETIVTAGGVAPEVIRIGPIDDTGHPLATVVRVTVGGAR